MVCDACSKKQSKVITPDPWKAGARNTIESGGRKLNENKLLSSKASRSSPYGSRTFAACRLCKQKILQKDTHYCHGCAYKKGICGMCGKKLISTKNYVQSSA